MLLYTFGDEVSEETRKNLSLAAKGRILTEEDRKKISSKRTGIQLSDVTRKKLSLSAADLRGVKVEIENVNSTFRPRPYGPGGTRPRG